MFTQKCFIRKYNKELIGKLQNLGYKFYGCYERSNATEIISTKNFDWQTQKAFGSMAIMGIRLEGLEKAIGKRSIDCGFNEEMFLALASLRDDSDINQWFVWGETWVLCNREEFHFFGINPDNVIQSIDFAKDFHKATPCEIVEHFKKD